MQLSSTVFRLSRLFCLAEVVVDVQLGSNGELVLPDVVPVPGSPVLKAGLSNAYSSFLPSGSSGTSCESAEKKTRQNTHKTHVNGTRLITNPVVLRMVWD